MSDFVFWRPLILSGDVQTSSEASFSSISERLFFRPSTSKITSERGHFFLEVLHCLLYITL
jgi:hypothetical protein